MSFLKTVADIFRSSPKAAGKVDKYNLISPIISTSEYVESTKKLLGTAIAGGLIETLRGNDGNTHVQKARQAYKSFVGGMYGTVKTRELSQMFSTVFSAIENIKKNLEFVEDNLVTIFGEMIGPDTDEADIKTSTLVVLGYIEMANEFMNWVSHLVAHVTSTDDLIPPYWTKSLLSDASKMGDYVVNNNTRWDPAHSGILLAIRELQQKGSDVAIHTGDMWLDEFVHDGQFSSQNQILITASFRNPTLWLADRKIVNYKKKVDLATTRKEWLLSKITLEEARMAGMSPDSPEYKRLRKITDHYVGAITKLEQELERLRS